MSSILVILSPFAAVGIFIIGFAVSELFKIWRIDRQKEKRIRRMKAALLVVAAISSLPGCYTRTIHYPPPMPRRAIAGLASPQNLTASDPCITRWGRPCVTNLNNTYTGKFLLQWDYFENVPGMLFVVRSNTLPIAPAKSWPIATVTPNKFFAITNMGTAAFFAVSASNPATGQESDFAQ